MKLLHLLGVPLALLAAGSDLQPATHQWKPTTDCTDEEIAANTPSMIERGWWRPGQSWLLETPPPGPECEYAAVLRKGPPLKWYQPDVGLVMGAVADRLQDSWPRVEQYMMKDTRHWGVYYFFGNHSVRMTDICLNVCDVRDDIPFKTYSNRLAQMSGVQPWPMDFCVWNAAESSLNTSETVLTPLVDRRFDCGQMWEAQTSVWSKWPRRTFGPANQCQHVVRSTIKAYDEAQNGTASPP